MMLKTMPSVGGNAPVQNVTNATAGTRNSGYYFFMTQFYVINELAGRHTRRPSMTTMHARRYRRRSCESASDVVLQLASAHVVMRPPLIRRSASVLAGRPSTAAEAGCALYRYRRFVPPLAARSMHNIGNGKMHMFRPSSLAAPFAAIYSGPAAATAGFSSSSSASLPLSPASSSPSPPQRPTIFQHISPEELSKLNQTSVGLYRLLLKECVRLRHFDGGGWKASSDHVGDDVMLLLQDEVNTDEFGKIQPYFGSDACADGSTSGKAASKQTPEEEQEASAVPALIGGDDDDIAAWSVINFFLRNMQTNQTQSDLLSKIDETLLLLGADSNNSLGRHGPQLLSVTPSQLVHAVRTAFLRVVVVQADEDVKKDDDNDDDNASGSYNNPELQSMALRSMTKADVVALHRRAIDAVPFLHAQRNLMECTSLGIDDSERGVSVFATSKWKSKGLLSRGAGLDRQEEHVFVYRIRIVYHRDSSKSGVRGKPIQLLGRRWMITDGVERKYEEHTGMDEDDDDDYEEPDVQVVDAPRTGVVGYHPVSGANGGDGLIILATL